MAMQATATPRKPRPNPYRKVLDSRKRRVRGLWQRNGRIYANLTVADDLGRKTSRWVPLAGATLDDAKADYARLVTERADDRLLVETSFMRSQPAADFCGGSDVSNLSKYFVFQIATVTSAVKPTKTAGITTSLTAGRASFLRSSGWWLLRW